MSHLPCASQLLLLLIVWVGGWAHDTHLLPPNSELFLRSKMTYAGLNTGDRFRLKKRGKILYVFTHDHDKWFEIGKFVLYKNLFLLTNSFAQPDSCHGKLVTVLT